MWKGPARGYPSLAPPAGDLGELKKRPGYRFSYCSLGTYKGEQFFDAEQITRNKLCIYTKEKHTDFDRRFLMKRVGRRLEDRCCAGAAGRLTAHGIVRDEHGMEIGSIWGGWSVQTVQGKHL